MEKSIDKNFTEDSSFSKILDEHLEKVRIKIIKRTGEIAGQSNESVPSISHLAQAIQEFAPGQLISEPEIKPSKGFFDYFPPVALLSAILAFTFASLGLWATLGSDMKGLNGQGFLDIAKIFAGAIVGSATSVAVSASRKK